MQLTPELLQGRTAKCYCGTERPSTDALIRNNVFGFEYRGPGAPELAVQCGVPGCGRNDVVHEDYTGTDVVWHAELRKRGHLKTHAFVPKSPEPFDRFYCGCRGWD